MWLHHVLLVFLLTFYGISAFVTPPIVLQRQRQQPYSTASTPDAPVLQLSSTQLWNQKWNDRFSELIDFRNKHGHINVDKSKNAALNNFVQNQRKEYRRWQRGEESSMDERRVELLNNLSFVWDMNQKIWQSRYAELLQFKADFGHVNVPIKYKTLGQWVTKHRKAKRAGSLSQSRVERLDDIGFIWDVKEWQFQRRLDQIKEFKETYGHIDIKVTDGEFGSWFYSRRKEYLLYLNGGNTTLLEEHRLALEEVGFGPHLTERRQASAIRSNATWETRFEELVRFKEQYNHTRVPKIPRYAQLSTWVNHQRNLKAMGKLARVRLLQLEDIQFTWNTNQWRWMKRYEDLASFQVKRGNTNVPRGGGDLGEWVDWQRVQFSNYEKGKKSQITAQRVTLLNNIGFDWNRGETRRIEWDLSWHRNLQQLKKYKEKHGGCNVPRSSDPALGLWVSQQRLHYKSSLRGEKTTLTDDRIAQLKQIGLFRSDDLSSSIGSNLDGGPRIQ